MKRIAIILFCLFSGISAFAQKDFGGIASFDRTVHDFGRINIRDGAVNCSFKVTNISDKPMNILAVVTSCGCTSATWTRTDIAPGASGTIEVTYKNDEGPYPFDKALSVYISGIERPVIIHVKGITVKGKK